MSHPPGRAQRAAERGQAVTTVAFSVAAAGMVVIATVGVAEFWLPTDPQSTPAPAPLLSRHIAPAGLMAVVPSEPASVPPAPEVEAPAVALPPPPVIAAAPPAPAAAPVSGTVAPSVRTELLEGHARWFAAYGNGDQAQLAVLEADGFRLLDMRPPRDRVSRSGAMERSLERVTVEISGDAVVLSAQMTERAAAGDGVRTIVSNLSEVWTPRGTGWRLLGVVIRPATP